MGRILKIFSYFFKKITIKSLSHKIIFTPTVGKKPATFEKILITDQLLT